MPVAFAAPPPAKSEMSEQQGAHLVLAFARILYANGQATEQTVAASERVGRALRLPLTVMPDWERIHMWTAPSLQDVGQCFDQIACVHMSGLLMRPHMGAGQDGFRDRDSKQLSDQQAAIGPVGVFRVVDQSITPSAHYFASSGIGSARLQFCCSPCLADF